MLALYTIYITLLCSCFSYFFLNFLTGGTFGNRLVQLLNSG